MSSISPASEHVARFRRDLEALTFKPTRLAIAVSGGPDSLALLLLAIAAYPDRVEAATVDHGLRPESADEAALVARHCAALGVAHETLAVTVQTDGHGLQSAARHERYTALEGWMARRGLDTLLTAHHLDDQAETLLMRLMRGSGVAGLAGIRSSVRFGGAATLYRPLLGWRRSELAQIVAAAGLEAVHDPANTDERFDRARIRRCLAQAPWLDPVPLARSAAALAQAEDVLALAAETTFVDRVRKVEGALLLDPSALPSELLRRLAARCLRTLVAPADPRGEQISALIVSLARGETMTLAGVKCTGGRVWRFEPAPPRRTAPPST